ncbi:hypothetical protein [Limosilactobacillus oris]|uniref:hypothetical protein n=1 Tax=Limosilactobacillus oris TaxID=1632 RepID=UPI001749CB59|nr:hypothetical protein [Limosilactobacillus oris]
MADELKMVRGEGLWQNKHNALVDVVEKMGGVVDDLQWTKQTKDGLVFPSGVEYVEGGYSYIPLGNCKLVFLSVAVKVTSDVKELAFSNLITLPDEIASNSPWIHWLGGLTEFQLLGNEIMIGDTNGNANRQWNNRTYVITALYVA